MWLSLGWMGHQVRMARCRRVLHTNVAVGLAGNVPMRHGGEELSISGGDRDRKILRGQAEGEGAKE